MKKLTLYVNGQGRSASAIANLKAGCEAHGAGQYEIEVIDVRTRPEAAREQNLIALPTLLGDLPAPVRKVVGNLADIDQIIGILEKSRI